MQPRQRQPRQEDRKHLAAIRQLPCLCCGTRPAREAAHLRMRSPEHGKPSTGIGTRPDDKWSVPLCHRCHMDQHKHGEREWWESQGIDPMPVAIELYCFSPNIERMTGIISRVRGRIPNGA
jgi:hypothetical protein